MNARSTLSRVIAGLLVMAIIVLTGGCASTVGIHVPYDRPYNIDYWYMQIQAGATYGYQPYSSVPWYQTNSSAMTFHAPVSPTTNNGLLQYGGSATGQQFPRSRYSLAQLRPKLQEMQTIRREHCSNGLPSERLWPSWECRKVTYEIAFLEVEITKEERAVGAQCARTLSERTGQPTVTTRDCSETTYGSWRH